MNKALFVTEAAHLVSSLFLGEGKRAIDATCGNGYDTLFLAEQVGVSGKVYAFDIQEPALTATRRLLSEKQYLDRVELIEDSHEHLAKHVENPVDAIFYNLGYLPGGPKEVTTKAVSTMHSLREGMKLLVDGGIISIVVYPGHAEGQREAAAIEGLLEKLPAPPWYVLSYKRLNSLKPSPYLLFLEKNS